MLIGLLSFSVATKFVSFNKDACHKYLFKCRLNENVCNSKQNECPRK